MIFLFSLILITFFLIPERYCATNPNLLFLYFTIGLIGAIFTIYKFHNKAGCWFSFDKLFLLAFFIAHFMVPVQIFLGSDIDPYIITSRFTINYATWLSLMGILFWMLGYQVVDKRTTNYSQNYPQITFTINSKVANGLIYLSFFLFLTSVGSDFYSGNYAGTNNWGKGASYYIIILKTSIYIKLFALFYNKRKLRAYKKRPINYIKADLPLFIIIAIYFILFIFSGDRGPIIELGLFLGALYNIYGRGIKGYQLIFIIIVGAFFLAIIELGRDAVITSDGNLIKLGYEQFKKQDNFIPGSELASTCRITFRAIDVVPNKHPYLFGYTYLSNIISSVPFGGRLLNPPEMYSSTPYFFTYLGQGPNYTYGEGSEIIADIYVNFGVFGVFILMFLFGLSIGNLNKAIKNDKSIYSQLIYFIIFSFVIYINRANYLVALPSIVITFIVMIVMKFNFSNKSIKLSL